MGTGISSLTSKERSMRTRHCLSQPGATGSPVYPKYKASGILEAGRGSKTKLQGIQIRIKETLFEEL